MPPLSFEGLLGVALIAFGAPLLLGLAPRLRVPAVVLEIVAGIVVGPSVLGWIRVDLPIAVLSTLGLTFLLFLAGMEIDFDRFGAVHCNWPLPGCSSHSSWRWPPATRASSWGLCGRPSF